MSRQPGRVAQAAWALIGETVAGGVHSQRQCTGVGPGGAGPSTFMGWEGGWCGAGRQLLSLSREVGMGLPAQAVLVKLLRAPWDVFSCPFPYVSPFLVPSPYREDLFSFEIICPLLVVWATWLCSAWSGRCGRHKETGELAAVPPSRLKAPVRPSSTSESDSVIPAK